MQDGGCNRRWVRRLGGKGMGNPGDDDAGPGNTAISGNQSGVPLHHLTQLSHVVSRAQGAGEC